LCLSQWPCGIVAAGLLGLWIRIPPEVWNSVSCDCCVLTGRGPSVGLITRTENSYWVLCIKWVWSRIPVIGCNDPESGRSTTENNWWWEVLYKNPNVFLWVICTKCICVHYIFLLRKYQNFNCISHWNLYTEFNFGSCWQQEFHNPNETSQRTTCIS